MMEDDKPTKMDFIKSINLHERCPCEKCKKEVEEIKGEYFKKFGEEHDKQWKPGEYLKKQTCLFDVKKV